MTLPLLPALVAAVVLMCSETANAQSRPASVEDLIALRDLGGLRDDLALSPDGRSIAVFQRETRVAEDNYQYSLLLIPLDGTTVRVIGDGGAFMLRSDGGRRSGIGFDRVPQYSPDGAWVYYIAERSGRLELWRSSTRNVFSEPVAQAAGDIARFAFAADGQHIFFETITTRNELSGDEYERQRFGFRINDTLTPSYSLQPLPDEARGRTIWRMSISGGEAIAIGDGTDPISQPAANAEIRTVSGFAQVARPPLRLFLRSHGAEIRCEATECTGALQEVWAQSSSTSEVIFRRMEGHARSYSAIYAWQPSTQRVRNIWRGEALLVGCVSGEGTLYCLQESTFQPRRLVAIDTNNGAQHIIFDPNPEWSTILRPRVERSNYTDADGNESFAHLIYPLNYRRGRAYPLVVVQYRSRGFLRGGTGGEFPILPLSAMGYAVLSIDRPEFFSRGLRLTRQELQRAAAIDGFERSSKVEAFSYFIDSTVRRGIADPNNIAITGMSDGAETVYYMLMDRPMFAAAIVSTPPTDPIAWPLQSEEFRNQRRREVGMDAPWSSEVNPWTAWWRRSSLFYRAEDVRTPLLMHMAESEVMRAFPLLTRMREGTTPIEAYLYPAAYHVKSRPNQLLASQRRSLAWIEFWLRQREIPDPTDADRFVRWQAMREAAPSTQAWALNSDPR